MLHLIVLSHLRWDYVYQRPQHLLSRLARHYRVLFIEEPVRADAPARFEVSKPADNVEVLRPHTPVREPGFHDSQLSLLKPLLSSYLREHLIDDYVVWFYTPMALPLIAQMRPRAVVYDCIDELSAFRNAPRQMRQREAALLKSAQIVFTSGPSLYAAKKQLHPNVMFLPSAVDGPYFAPQNALADAPAMARAEALQGLIARPRLGYFGVIDERLDHELIARLADAQPQWQIVMVGPIAKIGENELPRRANVHWLGRQPYELLPQIAAGWDLCLLPFALNDATRFICPTKTLEYMAAEKPVISTAVPDVVSLYGDVLSIAADAPAFIDACRNALVESGFKRTERIGRMLASLSRFSWDDTAHSVHRALQDLLAMQPLAGAPLPPMAEPARGRLPAAPRSAPRKLRHVIVGAGPTGLAAAYHLGLQTNGEDSLLIEREARVGGGCRSIVDHGFTFDHAGHIMCSADPWVLSLYERLLGDNLHWQNREAWIYSKGAYTRYPFQSSLYGLPPQVLKECLVGAIEARFGPLKGMGSAPSRKPPANFEEFIHRAWGAGIARHFAVPYNEKLWTVPLSEMEAAWLGARVPLPDLEQIIEGALAPAPAPAGPAARFGYPLRGGFQALMDAFVPLLQCELVLNTALVQLSPASRTLRLDDGRTVHYETLISTIPLPRLVSACGDEAPPEVQAAARGLRHVAVRCVNLGVARERISDKHWVYYPEDSVFHRIFMQGNASPHCNPPGGFGLTCEISYSATKPLPCEGRELIERVVADCRRVGLLRKDDRLVAANQLDVPCAYALVDHARPRNVAVILRWLSSHGIVPAGRYARWESYNAEHAFVAGRKAAEQVSGAGSADAVVHGVSDARSGNNSAAA
jgi:UDP-galactopyranose mutase